MTNEQKELLVEMRTNGLGYVKIADSLNISTNTVKSYCQRHGLGGVKDTAGIEVKRCKGCGKPVTQTPGKKEKLFCCDKCRLRWWNDHRELITRKANHEYICQCCGKPFIVYGNLNRKYCSQECYFESRYGGKKA